MSTFTFDSEKFALNPVICEGRQFSVICHVKSVLEAFPNYRSGRQIGDFERFFLDHFQTIFHNFPDILSMILVNTSFKSYDFACSNRDMPVCNKWNVFVPYDSKAAGNVRKVAENVDSSIFSWIL